MKFSIKNYLLYSSVFAIFTEAFFVNFIIDWKLLYVIILVNYYFLIKIQKNLFFNNVFVLIVIALFVHALLTNIFIGVPLNYMIAQLIGITIISTYFYNFFRVFTTKEVIPIYLKISLVLAIIAYPMWFFGIRLYGAEPRLQGIFKEPAHYAIVVLPACYYYYRTKEYLKSLVILGTIILSSSTIGYLGIGLMFVLPNLTFKRIKILLLIVPFVIGSFVYVYSNFEFFKLRVDDTYKSLNAVNTGKFEEYTNLSSYALLSNVFVTKENVTDHPLGSGIGSHYYMHTQHYIKQIRIPPYIVSNNLTEINAADACSLFLRICSETGILGFIAVMIALFYLGKNFRNPDLIFTQAATIYFLLKLFRDGHYFPPELYFFIWLFILEIKEHKQLQRINYDQAYIAD